MLVLVIQTNKGIGVVGPDPAIDDAAFGWRMLATPADDPSEVVNLYYFSGCKNAAAAAGLGFFQR